MSEFQIGWAVPVYGTGPYAPHRLRVMSRVSADGAGAWFWAGREQVRSAVLPSDSSWIALLDSVQRAAGDQWSIRPLFPVDSLSSTR